MKTKTIRYDVKTNKIDKQKQKNPQIRKKEK